MNTNKSPQICLSGFSQGCMMSINLGYLQIKILIVL